MPFTENRFGKRRTVNINEDLAIELNNIANAQGKTLFSLMNEIGHAQVDAASRGYSLSDAINALSLLERMKKSRMVLVNQDLWYHASSESMKNTSNKFLKIVYSNASWYASGFIDSSSDDDFVKSMKKFLESLFWDCTESKFERKDQDHLEMKLVFVPEMPEEHTKVLLKVFEAIFNVHRYFITDATVRGGYIRAIFRKVSTPEIVRDEKLG